MSEAHVAVAAQPVDAVLDRLNDPAIAASLVTLLDHAELLSTIVLGLSGFLERGDTIMDSVAAGVIELKESSRPGTSGFTFPTPADLTALTAALAKSTPVITEVLDSSMVNAETVALLSMISESASEGVERARSTASSVSGLRAAVRTLKDPEVARGLGMLVEISKALGRRLGPPST